MVLDHYTDPHRGLTVPASDPFQFFPYTNPTPENVTKEEFEALRRDVQEMKELLKKAKAYDERNNEPDCELDEKVAKAKKIADLVGIDLDDILGKTNKE